jgi:hypothetical protein
MATLHKVSMNQDPRTKINIRTEGGIRKVSIMKSNNRLQEKLDNMSQDRSEDPRKSSLNTR